MAHLNVIKGDAPGLSQFDMVAPTADLTITRGNAIYIAAGKFVKSTADAAGQGSATVAGPVAYFSLGNSADPDAKMAGVISGLACTDAYRLELDSYTGTPAVGDYMAMGADGNLVPHTDGLTAVLRVTKAAYTRYSNNAAVPGKDRTGNTITVIEGDTCFLPMKSLA